MPKVLHLCPDCLSFRVLTRLPPQIKQILFDCDNTLVLSEHLAFEACAGLANELLAAHGLPDRYTPSSLLSSSSHELRTRPLPRRLPAPPKAPSHLQPSPALRFHA